MTEPEIPRDRWGRPLINGKAYTRASTIANALEDANGLIDWKVRMVVDGVISDPLIEQAWRDASENRDKAIVAERALEAAGGRDAANDGTTIHGLLAAHADGMHVDAGAEHRDRWANIKAKVLGWTWLSSEEFGVDHTRQIAGTWDGIVSLPGDWTPRVMDLKTGRLHLRPVGIQLAAYAAMVPWTPDKGDGKAYQIAQDWGIVLHAPKGGPVRALAVDLEQGRRDLAAAIKLRELRKAKYPEVEVGDNPVIDEQEELLGLIARAADVDACRRLWSTHSSRWTAQHTALVQARFNQ